MRQLKKDAKIEVRLTAEEKQIIKNYFASQEVNLSEYIRKHLLQVAEEQQ